MMDNTNSGKKKMYRKASIRCRKLNSSSIKSQLSFSQVPAAGKYKQRIASLSNNNKMLAVALQDTRCELSSNKKLIEESMEYLNNITTARIKMIEMYSVLKSFMENFDEALLLLNFDDSKLLNLRAPTRLCKNFQSKMNQIVEADEEFSEEVSVVQGLNFDHEKVKAVEKSSNQVILSCDSTSNLFCNEVSEKDVDNVKSADDLKFKNQDSMENINCTQNVDIEPVSTSYLPSVSFCEGSDGMVKTRTKKGTSSKDNLEEDPQTPKFPFYLSTTNDLKACRELKSDFSSEKYSSVEKFSEILTNTSTDLASQKIKTSKIPIFSHKKIDTNLSKNSNRGEITCKRKFINKETEELNSNFCRRKTFVVKKNDVLSNPESHISLDNNLTNLGDISNEAGPDVNGEFETMYHRKTFVVKAPDTLEDTSNPESDRRKTFVKKSNNYSASVKNKRGTFTISKGNENNENEKYADEPVINDKNEAENVQLNDLDIDIHCPVKEKSINAKNSKELHGTSGKTDISVDIKSPPNTYSEVLESCNILIARELHTDNSAIESSKELKTKIDCVANGKKEDVDIIQMDGSVTSNKDLPKSVENNIEIIDISDSKRLHKNVSYKLFLESSDSECESIPEDDLNFANEAPSTLLKKCPIRRCISSSKKKKVFIFGSKERKSPVNKKSVSKCINSPKNDEICISDGTDLISNIENKDKITSKKNEDFISDEQSHKTNPVDNVHSDSCNKKEIKLKTAADEVKNKEIIQKKQNFDNADKEKLSSNMKKLNCIDKGSYGINASETCHENSLPVTANKNSNSTDTKQYKKNLNKEHYPVDILSYRCKETTSNEKENPLKDNITTDDIIPLVKKRKKNGSKKKFYLGAETVISDNTDNVMNNLIETKNPEVKAKCVNKGKSKRKKEVPHKKIGKNTFLVHAEVHPPPSWLNTSGIESMDKENKKELELEKFQVSVILNDIFKTESDNIKITSEKDLILPGRTCTQKIPFSDNSCNIPILPVESTLDVCKNLTSDSNTSEEIITTRRRHKNVSYKEPLLNKKLRR